MSYSENTSVDYGRRHPTPTALLHLEKETGCWLCASEKRSSSSLPGATTLRSLIWECLFVRWSAPATNRWRANASRLSVMERADRNIKDSLERLHGRFHRQRQDAIDEELFDVTAGYEVRARP